MLLYHTGPQVFQRSLTIACEMRKRQRERQLMPISHSHTHTNAHCNPGPFSKGSGVLYHWISSQLACYSSLHSPMYQTHYKTLFVFMILNPDLIVLKLQLWVYEKSVPTKTFGLMCLICQCDHRTASQGTSQRFGKIIQDSEDRVAAQIWIIVASWNSFGGFHLYTGLGNSADSWWGPQWHCVPWLTPDDV